jgi:hypothetical protein
MLLEIAWEQLHLGHWSDVAPVWRDLYSLASLLAAHEVMVCTPPQPVPAAGHDGQPLNHPLAAGDPPSQALQGAGQGSNVHATATSAVAAPCDASAAGAAAHTSARVLDLGLMMGGPTWAGALHAAMTALEKGVLQGKPAVTPAAALQQPSTAAGGPLEQGVMGEGEASGSPAAGDITGADAVMESVDSRSPKRSRIGVWGGERSGAAVRLPPGSLEGGGDLATRPPVLAQPSLEMFLTELMLADGGVGQPAIVTGMCRGVVRVSEVGLLIT